VIERFRLPFNGRCLVVVLVLSVAVSSCGAGDDAPYTVTARFPHDASSYTQGLVWGDSVLFESAGLYGRSQVRRVNLRSGRVLLSRALDSSRFGEGLALLKDRLYQLTWREHVAYTYDAATLAPRDSFHYAGEGWGLATDGTSLIMSDGSDSLRILSPETFKVQRVVHVHYRGSPVYQLNELEYIDGAVVANVYQTNFVLWIDPTTGAVSREVDFADLYPDRSLTAEVMNGIALAPDRHQLLLTGKFWPVMFQVRMR
jgi:glutamine cyclotransferase